jgi:hypothetical protein
MVLNSLSTEANSVSDYGASNDRMVNIEYERMWCNSLYCIRICLEHQGKKKSSIRITSLQVEI